MERASRLESTRHRPRLARYAVVAVSTVAFGDFGSSSIAPSSGNAPTVQSAGS